MLFNWRRNEGGEFLINKFLRGPLYILCLSVWYLSGRQVLCESVWDGCVQIVGVGCCGGVGSSPGGKEGRGRRR